MFTLNFHQGNKTEDGKNGVSPHLYTEKSLYWRRRLETGFHDPIFAAHQMINSPMVLNSQLARHRQVLMQTNNLCQ